MLLICLVNQLEASGYSNLRQPAAASSGVCSGAAASSLNSAAISSSAVSGHCPYGAVSQQGTSQLLICHMKPWKPNPLLNRAATSSGAVSCACGVRQALVLGQQWGLSGCWQGLWPYPHPAAAASGGAVRRLVVITVMRTGCERSGRPAQVWFCCCAPTCQCIALRATCLTN